VQRYHSCVIRQSTRLQLSRVPNCRSGCSDGPLASWRLLDGILRSARHMRIAAESLRCLGLAMRHGALPCSCAPSVRTETHQSLQSSLIPLSGLSYPPQRKWVPPPSKS